MPRPPQHGGGRRRAGRVHGVRGAQERTHAPGERAGARSGASRFRGELESEVVPRLERRQRADGSVVPVVKPHVRGLAAVRRAPHRGGLVAGSRGHQRHVERSVVVTPRAPQKHARDEIRVGSARRVPRGEGHGLGLARGRRARATRRIGRAHPRRARAKASNPRSGV